jgi:S-adenosylmethionine decarboxylase
MGSNKVKVFRGGALRPEGPGSVKRMDNKPYGLELILDLKGCGLPDLSREKLTDYFVRLCDLIQMTRHGEPLFWEDHSGLPHLQGISAVQFIETSNVVCHALPLLQAVYLNIFSCREFDTEVAKQFSTAFWGAESVVFTVVTRT